MSLIHNSNFDGPATHVMIIGVGHYPHLIEGTGTRSEYHDGMGQLTSPPISAREIANWFVTKYRHPQKPLSTVSMLLSEVEDSQYHHPVSNNTIEIQRATLSNIKSAIRSWKTSGDEDEENLMIFYYCGHGIAQGPDLALLAAEYGSDDENLFDAAIDFKTFQERMKRNCLAGHQIFFIDACRSSTDTLIETFGQVGDPIITGPGTNSSLSTVFYSTLAGEKAYGKTGQPSSFTQMLLKSLSGGGAHDQNNDWRVSTTRLKEAIDLFMERASNDGEQKLQTPPTDGLVTYDFHYLENVPEIEVRVQCSPLEANDAAELSLTSTNDQRDLTREGTSEKPWDIKVTIGEYIFKASFNEGPYHSRDLKKYVNPPSPLINIIVDV